MPERNERDFSMLYMIYRSYPNIPFKSANPIVPILKPTQAIAISSLLLFATWLHIVVSWGVFFKWVLNTCLEYTFPHLGQGTLSLRPALNLFLFS